MKFLLFVNGDKPDALALAKRLAARWDGEGTEWTPCEADADLMGVPAKPIEEAAEGSAGAGGAAAAEGSEAAAGWTGVVLGGDGTLLRAARTAPGVPLLVVNFGTVGFLASVEPSEAEAALDALAAGRMTTEQRITIEARVDGGPPQEAVNEVVVGRRMSRRTVQVMVEVDGEELWRWAADGVLVTTPTGSTAYALSAGGPLVVPGADVLTVVPICPHALLSRAIVLPAESVIRMMPAVEPGGDVAVTADGLVLAAGTISEVTVRRAARPLTLIVPVAGRFSRLRHKLVAWSTQGENG